MLKDRVKCAVPNPGGPIGVGSTITLGAASPGFRTFLTAFGAAVPAFFVLSDGGNPARTLGGIWTVNGDGTATITSILINDRLSNTSAETFSSACTAWCDFPAASLGGQLVGAADAAAGRSALGAEPQTIASAGIGQFVALNSGSNVAITLPAGGTWAWWRMAFTDAGAIIGGQTNGGVNAGGTIVGAAVVGWNWAGWAKRVS